MIDLTKINTPFGKLDAVTKGALLWAHHLGRVIEFKDSMVGWDVVSAPMFADADTYRVRPGPVIGAAVFRGIGPIYHSLHPDSDNPGYKLTVTFQTRDGAHIPGVYTSPEGLRIVVEVAE